MRLNRFLVESRVDITDKPDVLEDDYPAEDMDDDDREDAIEVAKLIRDNCKEFIKKCNGKMMWRGYSGGAGGWSERTVRSDRYPKDTPQEVHDELNSEFESTFGWEARNGVFCTGDQAFAEGYGRLISIWPKDGFKFVWADYIQDLYADKSLGDLGGYDDEYLWEEFANEWEDEYGDPRINGYDMSSQGEFTYEGDYTGADNFNDAVNWALYEYAEWENFIADNEEKISMANEYRELILQGEQDKAEILKDGFDQNFPYEGDIEDWDMEDDSTAQIKRDELWDEIANDEHGEFEWEPEVDQETYIEDRIEQYREDYGYAGDVSEIVDEYRDDDLEAALNSGNEIMLGPNDHEYYAVDVGYTDIVWMYAFGFQGRADNKQLKFDFGFKANPKIDKGIWKGNRFFAGAYNVKTDAIEYLQTYRDLTTKNKKAMKKPKHDWHGAWMAPVFDPYKWLPREQLKRYQNGQIAIFLIPSIDGPKYGWPAVKFISNYNFPFDDDQKLARMVSMHVKIAT